MAPEKITENMVNGLFELLASIENAKDISEIYDINNEYRQELINDVLYQAMDYAIAQDSEKITVELDINLTYQDGKWWVVSSSALIDAIFGDVLF